MFALRRASSADIPMLWQVRTQAIRFGCRDFYSADDVERWASVPMPAQFPAIVSDTEFFILSDAVQIAAFGFLDVSKSEIGGLFVHADFQGLGLGRRLLETLEIIGKQSALPSLSLIATLNAELFYAASGFHSQGRSKWQHPNGFELDCVRMTKQLASVLRASD
jgi:putative acetyltransferase